MSYLLRNNHNNRGKMGMAASSRLLPRSATGTNRLSGGGGGGQMQVQRPSTIALQKQAVSQQQQRVQGVISMEEGTKTVCIGL